MKNVSFILIIVFYTSYSQWQPEFRLTYDQNYSSTSYNNARCIASEGDYVYAVWMDNRDVNNSIYFKRSTDGGISWGEDIKIANPGLSSENPSIAVSGENLHVAWEDIIDDNREIFYKHSYDRGESWSEDIRLTNHKGASSYPCITVSGDFLHIVWYDTQLLNENIYYIQSADNGLSWSEELKLSKQTFTATVGTIGAWGSSLHVLWSDYGTCYKRSTDHGFGWEDEKVIYGTSLCFPSVSVWGRAVHVAVQYRINNVYQILYLKSTDEGVTWSDPVQVSTDTTNSYRPVIAAQDSIIHIIWRKIVNGYYQLKYSRSADGGTSWENEEYFTFSTINAYNPSITLSGPAVHVVWSDSRDGNDEIYYKRNPTGNLTGISKIKSGIPRLFSLLQNYPNPFNPVTKIRFEIPAAGAQYIEPVQLKIYDVLGSEVQTLVNEKLSPGTYEVDFDGSNLPSGVYYYQLKAGDYSETRKMVLIK